VGRGADVSASGDSEGAKMGWQVEDDEKPTKKGLARGVHKNYSIEITNNYSINLCIT
jgi:hypothetical protein